MGNSKFNGRSTGYGASTEDGSKGGFCSVTIPNSANNLNYNVGGFQADLVCKDRDGKHFLRNGLESVSVKRSAGESNDSTWVQPIMTGTEYAGGDKFATSVDGQKEITGFESYKLFDGLQYTYGSVGNLEGHLEEYTIPTLTADGTMGGTDFAVAITECTGVRRGGQAYLPFGGTNDNQHYIGIYGNEDWKKLTLVMYTPEPTIMKSLVPYFIIVNDDAQEGNIYGLQVYGSNDNNTWTSLYEHINYFHVTNSRTKGEAYRCDMPENNTLYKYYKMTITTSGHAHSDAAYISKIDANLYTYSEETITTYSAYYYPTPIKITNITYTDVYESAEVYGMNRLVIDATNNYVGEATVWTRLFDNTVNKNNPVADLSGNTGYYKYYRIAGAVDSATGGLYPVYNKCTITAYTNNGRVNLGDYYMFVEEDGAVVFEDGQFYRQPNIPLNITEYGSLTKNFDFNTSSLMYAWSSSVLTGYTLTSSPKIGQYIISESGYSTGWYISSVSTNTLQARYAGNTITFTRNGELDKNISEWSAISSYRYSNFTSSNYLKFPDTFSPGTNNWEIMTHVTVGNATGSDNQEIIGGDQANTEGLEFGINPAGKFIIWLGTSTSSYDIANGVTGSRTVANGEEYFVRVNFNGSSYTLAYSTNGVDFTTDITVNSTAKIYGARKCLGLDGYGKAGIWTGTIDLAGTYIKIGNDIVWTPILDGTVWENTSRYPAKTKKYDLSAHTWKDFSGVYIGYTNITSTGASKVNSEPFCSQNINKPNDCRPASIIESKMTYPDKVTVTEYYKYITQTWVQPSPTSNGVMGQGDFACAHSWYSTWQGDYQAFRAFSGGTWSTLWEDNSTGRPPQWISWYTKNPIKLISFTFNQWGEPWYYYITSAVIQGSENNIDWVDIGSIGNCYSQESVTITVNSPTHYNYHRIYVTGANWYGSYYGFRISNLRINAQEKYIVRSTAEDYDIAVQTSTDGNLWGVGTPNITDGVLTNPTNANYVKTNQRVTLGSASNWEIMLKSKFTSYTAVNDGFAGVLGGAYNVNFYKSDNQYLCCELSSNGTSYNLAAGQALSTGEAVPLNTWVYTKVVYDGTSYKLYYGTDKNNLTLKGTISNSTKVSTRNNTFAFGVDEAGGHNAWQGQIDLKECYIKINGEYVWEGETSTPAVNNFSGTKWYNLYSDGWIEQGVNIRDVGGTRTFDFFKPMKMSSYNVTASGDVTGITNKTTTNLSYTANGGDTNIIVAGYVGDKAVTRRYYKYAYYDWALPKLTSNGSFGGNQIGAALNFGRCNSSWGTPYKAFSPYTDRVGFYCNEYKSSMYVSLYLPTPTNLKYISFQLDNGWADAASGAYNTQLFAGNYKNDRSYRILNIGTVGQYNFYSSSINHSGYYKYFTLYIENGGWAHEDRFEIRSIYFSGREKKSVESTAEDYDYYIDL